MTETTETPKHPRPYLIQRLSSRSKNNQVKFSDRYYFDYMGATEFERGTLPKTIRVMHGQHEYGEFEVDGIRLYAAWNPENYNAAGVRLVLDGLLREQIRTKEYTGFTARKYQEQKALDKNRIQLRQQYPINAWFEIEGGLFWTWEKINLKDLALNFAKSVEWMDQLHATRREKLLVEPKGRATLQSKLAEALSRKPE